MQHAATASSVIGIDVCRVLIDGLEIRYLASDSEVLPPVVVLVAVSLAPPSFSAVHPYLKPRQFPNPPDIFRIHVG